MSSIARTSGYWFESHLGRRSVRFLYVLFEEAEILPSARGILQKSYLEQAREPNP